MHAHPDFQLVISYNPGYQNIMKDLKQSTKQRFGALDFGWPTRDIEIEIVAHESGAAPEIAAQARDHRRARAQPQGARPGRRHLHAHADLRRLADRPGRRAGRGVQRGAGSADHRRSRYSRCARRCREDVSSRRQGPDVLVRRVLRSPRSEIRNSLGPAADRTVPDLDPLLQALPPQARQLVCGGIARGSSDPESASAERLARRRRTAAGCRRRSESHRLPICASLPALCKQAGEAHLPADRRSLPLHSAVMPTRGDSTPFWIRCRRRRAASIDPMRCTAIWTVVDELAGLAPGGCRSCSSDSVVARSASAWTACGAGLCSACKATRSDVAAQAAWFRLESQDARAILRAAGEGMLFTDVERRLGFYLRALWAREPERSFRQRVTGRARRVSGCPSSMVRFACRRHSRYSPARIV